MPSGSKCSVSNCKNIYKNTKKDKSLKYHPLPKDDKLRQVWIKSCRRGLNWNPQMCFVCSKHFKEEDFVRDLKAELLGLPPKRHLKPMAVPSLHLPTDETQDTVEIEDDDQEEELDLLSESLNPSVEDRANVSTQTEFFKENYNELLLRIANLESIIEHYTEIVDKFKVENEMLEASLKEMASIKEKSVSKQQVNSTKKRTREVVIQNEEESKRKKLLWNTNKMDKVARLKYLCKGCYIITS